MMNPEISKSMPKYRSMYKSDKIFCIRQRQAYKKLCFYSFPVLLNIYYHPRLDDYNKFEFLSKKKKSQLDLLVYEPETKYTESIANKIYSRITSTVQT